MERVESIALKTAKYINSNVEGASSIEVLKFVLISLINYIIVAFSVLVFCLFSGHLLEGLISIIVIPFFRQFTGGIHFKSSTLCNATSIILVLIAIHVPFKFYPTGILLSIISILILLKNAPHNIKGFSKLESKYYPILKVMAILIVMSNFLLQSPLLVSLFFVQSLLTLHSVEWFVVKFKF